MIFLLAISFALLACAHLADGGACRSPNPCLNSGTCSEHGSDYKCACPRGYTGRQCSVRLQTTGSSNPKKECRNKDKNCAYWARSGYCTNKHSVFMEKNCCASCSKCRDKQNSCAAWARSGLCTNKYSGYMKDNCCASCSSGPCQPNPCENSGTCSRNGSSFTCKCSAESFGKTCESLKPIDMFAGLGMEHILSTNISLEFFNKKFSGGSKYRSYRKDRHGPTDSHACGTVTAVPTDLRFITRYNHYRKYTHAYGIPIISTSAVSNKALDRACYVLRFLLADRVRIRKYLYYNWGRIGIMGRREGTTSIPEHRHLGAWWDTRARGLGGTLAIPISTGAEENLLCERGDRYPREDIFLHEFSHGIQEVAIRGGGIPGYFPRLQRQYSYARRAGLWRATYAMSTVQEYFAEGVQSYFHVNDYSARPNGVHGPINTRAKLKSYDPTLYKLIKEVFPCGNWITTNCDEKNGKPRKKFQMNCDGEGTKPKPPKPATKPPTQGPPPTPEFTDAPTGQPPPPDTPPPPKTPAKTPPPPQTPPPPKPTTLATKPPKKKGCDKDEETDCSKWAAIGYCLKSTTQGKKYSPFMHDKCRKSCGCCDDKVTTCAKYKAYCGTYYMERVCKKTCSYCD